MFHLLHVFKFYAFMEMCGFDCVGWDVDSNSELMKALKVLEIEF